MHRAKAGTAWAAENAGRIELFYLLPYAPEWNPDEYLNNDVKQALGRRGTPRDKAAMEAGLRSHMRALQRHPSKVRSFFQAQDVRSAARLNDTYLNARLVTRSDAGASPRRRLGDRHPPADRPGRMCTAWSG